MAYFGLYSIASMILGFIVSRIVELLFGGILGGLMAVVKPVSFVASWSAMTAYMGMRKFTSGARRLRERSTAARNLFEKE